MGRARIISGGQDGRYVIEMDYGSAQRDALIAKIELDLYQLALRKTWQEEQLDEVAIGLVSLQNEQTAFINAYVAASKLIPPNNELTESIRKQLDAKTAEVIRQQLIVNNARVALGLTNAQIKSAELERAKLEQAEIIEQRPAWCADLTENATGTVATLEVPGESALILVKPSAPEATITDGRLIAREVQTPAQVFWNAAVLPGWQKFKPTYRWGTITELNTLTDRCTVALAEAKSSAQQLNVNQAATLANVPIVYMTCNAAAFMVGSNVIIEFTGQDWEQPKVIGFLDHPRSCGSMKFTCIPADTTHIYGWTVPLTEGNGTPATITTRSYSGVHVPTKVTDGLSFVTAQIKRAQQNTVPPNVADWDDFYNPGLFIPSYDPGYDLPTGAPNTANLTSSLHSINREWISPDRKTCVSTAFDDVRVNGFQKGNPGGGMLVWSCIMERTTPEPATRMLVAWCWSAPRINVFTRPLADDEGTSWTLVASKSVVDFDPDAMVPGEFPYYGTEDLNPETCWLRKGSRNATGNVCSVWAQSPRYWRYDSYGEGNIWAWVIDFNINTLELSSTMMETETVAQVGPPNPYHENASFSQSGTRAIDFDYVGDSKVFTTLTFTGGYSYTASESGGIWYNAESCDLKIVLTRGDYTLKLYEDAYTKSGGVVTSAACTYVNIWYYGTGVICFHRLITNGSSSTREFRMEFPGASATGINLITPDTSSEPTPVGRQNFPFAGTRTSKTSRTSFLINAIDNFVECRWFRQLDKFHKDQSLLNFRVVDNVYLISLPMISFDYGHGDLNRIELTTGAFKTWCSDESLLPSFGVDAGFGVLGHIKLV